MKLVLGSFVGGPEAALHRLIDRHRYRPYVLPYLKLGSGEVSVNTIKKMKKISSERFTCLELHEKGRGCSWYSLGVI